MAPTRKQQRRPAHNSAEAATGNNLRSSENGNAVDDATQAVAAEAEIMADDDGQSNAQDAADSAAPRPSAAAQARSRATVEDENKRMAQRLAELEALLAQQPKVN